MSTFANIHAVELVDVGRHRRDVVRAVVGFVAVFLPAFVVGEADPGRLERWLFRTVNHLPGTLNAPLVGVMQAGALGAVGVASAGAVLLRRAALARSFAVGGLAAWACAKGVGLIVHRSPPDEALDQIVLHGIALKPTVFPSTHAAVVAALAVAAMPYLGRFGRRASAVVVVLVGFSRLFVGAQFPVDVVAGFGVGVVVGSLVHLIWGSPRRVPSISFIESVVAQVGLTARSVDRMNGSRVPTFNVETGSGTAVRVLVFGHDEDLGWLYRLWRFVAFRDAGDQTPFRSASERAREYITCCLLAERYGVNTVRFIDLIDARSDRAVVVTSAPPGIPLDRLDAEPTTDRDLRAVLTELSRLHACGVADRTVRLAGLARAGDGSIWFTDLTEAEPNRNPEFQAREIATLLAVLAARTSPGRTVAAAVDVLAPDRLEGVIDHLQPLALAADRRRDPAINTALLSTIRHEISDRTGAPLPTVSPPVRVAARNIAVLVAAAIAVNVLLAQFGRARHTTALLRAPHWPWIAVVGVASLATYVMAAVSAIGSTSLRVAPGRTFLVQLAAAFTNRLSPAGLGGMATNVRYLERAGATRAGAASSVALNSVAGLVTHLIALAVFAPSFGGFRTAAQDLPDYWPWLVVAVVLLAVAGVIAIARYAPKLRQTGADAVGDLRAILRHPGRATLLFGGSVGVTFAYATALAASMRAFNAHPRFVDVLVVFLISSAVAAASPTPGGLGALEAALVAGFTRSGIDAGPAVAGVLCYRLVTYWAPVLPGFVSFRFLRRTAVL